MVRKQASKQARMKRKVKRLNREVKESEKKIVSHGVGGRELESGS